VTALSTLQGEVDLTGWHRGLAQLRERGAGPTFAFPHAELQASSRSNIEHTLQLNPASAHADTEPSSDCSEPEAIVLTLHLPQKRPSQKSMR
jgi:hypothetical protein